MSGSFRPDGALDLADGRIILCVGKKRSGKSILAKLLVDGAPELDIPGYPWDVVVLDIAGDDGPNGPDVDQLHGDVNDLPTSWPEHLRRCRREHVHTSTCDREARMILRYVPDAGSPTFLADMDAVVALALKHGKQEKHDRGRGCCLLVHEVGVLAPAGQTQPHTRRALMHNRHNGLTLVACGPRPMTIDPLVVQQADVVYTFELMNPADRQRLAESMGWHPKDFSAAVHELPPHGYLRFDANEDKPEEGEDDLRLIELPPLPADVVRAVR